VILTDREIQIAIERKLIRINPPPDELAYSSTSLDLTLDSRITQFKKNLSFLPRVIDVTHPDYDYDTALDELSTTEPIPHAGFDLPTKELVLGWTAEYINIPVDTRLAARVEGKSSLARIGIGIHLTAPTIHAGFKGQIRLEIINHGPAPIKLKAGMRICQLIFEMTLGTPETGYQGQFLDQESSANH
jgi:dCTP deaminase